MKLIKNFSGKSAAAAAIVLITALAGVAVFASTGASEAITMSNTVRDTSASGETDVYSTLEDEAVYVFTEASGAVKKVYVSDWIKDAGGDSYSRDQVEENIPVDMKISYTLDGAAISPEELAGKSGNVTIRFDYVNNAVVEAEIGDKTEKIHVPFTMLTGMILSNDVFSNVEVTNGRLINDGSRQIVVGFALPGIQEDLEIDDSVIEIPDHFEISADVKDFEMDMTLTIGSPKLLEQLDIEGSESLDELKDSLDKMGDAVSQLLDGSVQLSEGLDTLLEKSGSLTNGVSQLANGAWQVNDGASQLADGAGSLANGSGQLSNGLDELASNSSALNNGAAQVFNTLLSVAQSQIEASGQSIPSLTIGNYSSVLSDLINSLDASGIYAQAESQVTAGVDALGDSLYAQYIDSIEESIYKQYLESISDSIIETYINNTADDIYAKYIDSIADDLYQTYLESIADTIYSQYIDSISSDLINSYILSRIPDEQKASMSEEELAQTVQAMASALTDDEIAQIKAGALAQLTDEQKAQILAGAAANLSEDQKAQIRAGALAQLTDDQKAQILAGAISGLTEDQKAQILAGAYEQLSDDEKAQIKAGALAQLTDEQKAEIRQGAIDKTMASDEVQSQITAASESVKQLAQLKAQLDTYNQFYTGLAAYTAGVSSAADGAATLKNGAYELYNGASALSGGTYELYSGITELQSNLPALIEGITSLRDGSRQITEGINTFNEEAIQKLQSMEEEDLQGLLDRVKALRQAAENYRFMEQEGAAKSDVPVQFIYRSDGINVN